LVHMVGVDNPHNRFFCLPHPILQNIVKVTTKVTIFLLPLVVWGCFSF